MIYFFSKDEHYTRCEIHPGRPHVLTVVDPTGQERVERYISDTDLRDRWAEVTTELVAGGWSGPFGRGR